MALTPIKLPQLQARIAIVDAKGQPTPAFVRYWNLDLLKPLEGTVNEIIQIQNGLAQVVATQTEEIARLNAALAQIQALLGLTQQAQEAANNAQQTADEALADGTVSGSATDPSVDVNPGPWTLGPQIDLTSVLAGTLTISGSGPQQDANVALSGDDGTSSWEFRVVEVVGGIDDVVFTGSFSADLFSGVTYITNTSASAVSSFSSARTSTGAVSYRIDARPSGGVGLRSISDLLLYVYARRAP